MEISSSAAGVRLPWLLYGCSSIRVTRSGILFRCGCGPVARWHEGPATSTEAQRSHARAAFEVEPISFTLQLRLPRPSRPRQIYFLALKAASKLPNAPMKEADG